MCIIKLMHLLSSCTQKLCSLCFLILFSLFLLHRFVSARDLWVLALVAHLLFRINTSWDPNSDRLSANCTYRLKKNLSSSWNVLTMHQMLSVRYSMFAGLALKGGQLFAINHTFAMPLLTPHTLSFSFNQVFLNTQPVTYLLTLYKFKQSATLSLKINTKPLVPL